MNHKLTRKRSSPTTKRDIAAVKKQRISTDKKGRVQATDHEQLTISPNKDQAAPVVESRKAAKFDSELTTDDGSNSEVEHESKEIGTKCTEAKENSVDTTDDAQERSSGTENAFERETSDATLRKHGLKKTITVSQGHSILTEHEFGTHPDIHEHIKKGIEKMGLTHMTQIQHATINIMLEGRDVLGAAKTGSGKTLAFVIPALNLLMSGIPVTNDQGTIILIMAPTRELVEQIYEVAREVGQHLKHTIGAVTGGTKRKTETEQLSKGVSLLIATPGRLLDHLNNARHFVYSNLKLLILDEADRILDQGFQRDLEAILAKLPRKGRQTALFSATINDKLQEIIRLNMKKPKLVMVKDSDSATVIGVNQGYVHVSPEIKLSLLCRLLQRKLKNEEKVMVFFSTCNSVQFHEDLLNYIGIPCLGLHGEKKQNHRTSIYSNFVSSKTGILVCTNVAARGLDFPAVHCIIQFDPPDTETEYIHRIGRTGRGQDATGSGILFLLSEELGFLSLLEKKNVKLKEYVFQASSLSEIHKKIVKVVKTNFHLAEAAYRAYKAFMLAYKSHSLKHIFNVNSLDITKIANGFGLETPPRVDLNNNALKRSRIGKSKRR